MALEWIYKLDEGSGTAIINTGSNTQGNYQNLPIYDTDALMGDLARHIEIPTFTIPAGDDFRVSFDWIRVDSGNQSTETGVGQLSSIDNYIRMYDSDHATIPNNIRVFVSGTAVNFANALDDVAQGEHISMEIHRVGAFMGGSINDSILIEQGANAGEASFDAIGVSNGFSKIPANSALQNVILENLTTGAAIGYKINEGSGFTVKAYTVVNGEITDTEVPASDGTVIPSDGLGWEYIPPYSNNGSWTPDTDWVFIDSNTRYYPMNEGTGDTFRAFNGKGEQTPVNDATIFNFTDNWS